MTSSAASPIVLAFSGGLDTSLLRAGARRGDGPADRDRDGRHRRPRRRGAPRPRRTFARPRCGEPPADRRARRRTSIASCDTSSSATCGAAASIPLCVGAERVLQAQEVARLARELGATSVAHGSHRGGQRPGPLRGRPAHAGARARDPRAGARRSAAAGGAGGVPRVARPAGAAARRGVLDQPRALGRHHRRPRDAGQRGAAAREAWVLSRGAFDAPAHARRATCCRSSRACPRRSTARRSHRWR